MLPTHLECSKENEVRGVQPYWLQKFALKTCPLFRPDTSDQTPPFVVC